MQLPKLSLPDPRKALSSVRSNLDKVGKVATQGTKKAQQAATQAQRLVGDTFSNGKKVLDGAGKGLQKVQKDLGDKFNRLSDAEKRFLSTNLHLAKPFSDAADKADTLSRNYATKNLKGNDADIYKDNAANAIRHASWNALMVKRAFDNPVGGGDTKAAAVKAFEFATAHEDNPKNTNKTNMKMDLHNNTVGRNVALAVLAKNPKASDEEIFKAVVDAFKQGKMKEVSGDPKKPETQKLVTAS